VSPYNPLVILEGGLEGLVLFSVHASILDEFACVSCSDHTPWYTTRLVCYKEFTETMKHTTSYRIVLSLLSNHQKLSYCLLAFAKLRKVK